MKAPARGGKDDVEVSVEVTNAGQREGDEVAQLYVREDVGSVETPERSLKGFERIHLGPAKTQMVTFRVPQEQLAVWNREQKWAIEAGSYTVWVGGSSEASLSAKFELQK